MATRADRTRAARENLEAEEVVEESTHTERGGLRARPRGGTKGDRRRQGRQVGCDCGLAPGGGSRWADRLAALVVMRIL